MTCSLRSRNKHLKTTLTLVPFLMTFISLSLSTAHAEPVQKNALNGISPVADRWVSMKMVPPTKVKTLSEEEIKDPKKLLEFLKSRPDALDPTNMNQFIAVEVGQTLLYGGEVRRAIQLLNAAKQKWPNDRMVLQTWARALIKSGQPSYVRHGIEAWQNANTSQTMDSYTLYLYALSVYLEGPEEQKHLIQAISLIDQLLRNDPQYVGPDGIDASRLKSFKAELLERISPSHSTAIE